MILTVVMSFVLGLVTMCLIHSGRPRLAALLQRSRGRSGRETPAAPESGPPLPHVSSRDPAAGHTLDPLPLTASISQSTASASSIVVPREVWEQLERHLARLEMLERREQMRVVRRSQASASARKSDF